jgi:hypothetical protein
MISDEGFEYRPIGQQDSGFAMSDEVFAQHNP